MKRFVLILLGGLLLAGLLIAGMPYYDRYFYRGWPASLTIRAIDDEGNPVPGAQVWACFQGIGTARDIGRRGVSDAQGIVRLQARAYYGILDFGASKDGYYAYNNRVSARKMTGRWYKAWVPIETTALVKPKTAVVPRYARSVGRGFTPNGVSFSFDFVKGDWLPPHGKGETPDVTITMKRDMPGGEGCGSFSATVRFPNPGDGYVPYTITPEDACWGSEMKSPRCAPESGYQPGWNQDATKADKGAPETLRGDWWNDHYFLRIRTRFTGTGAVESALYGRLRGALAPGNVWYGDKLDSHFVYILNPDGGRNLEFDPAQNLWSDQQSIIFP